MRFAAAMPIRVLILPVCVLAVALICSAGAEPEKPLTELAFTDVAGKSYRLPRPDDCKAIVLIFFGYDCPISNAYVPEFRRIYEEYSPKNVAFCIVYADADLALEDARKHAKDYGFTCPAILDPKMVLSLRFGATVKPEAAVLSPKGELLYRGRIDNLYLSLGKKQAKPTQWDLRDALTSVLAGQPVATTRTKAIGCAIDLPARKK